MMHVQMEEPKMELAIPPKNAVIVEEPMTELAQKDMECAAHVSQSYKILNNRKKKLFLSTFQLR